MNVGYHPAPTDLLTYHRPAAMLLGRSMHRMRVIGLVTYGQGELCSPALSPLPSSIAAGR